MARDFDPDLDLVTGLAAAVVAAVLVASGAGHTAMVSALLGLSLIIYGLNNPF